MAILMEYWPMILGLLVTVGATVAGLFGIQKGKTAEAKAATATETAKAADQRAASASATAEAAHDALKRVQAAQEARVTVDAAIAPLPVGQAEKELRDEFGR